jgi:hypothetical protein
MTTDALICGAVIRESANQRFSETLHRRYVAYRDQPSQKPFMLLLVLTMCASFAARSIGKKRGCSDRRHPADVEGALPFHALVNDHASTATDNDPNRALSGFWPPHSTLPASGMSLGGEPD